MRSAGGFAFGPFLLDTDNQCLRRGSETIPLKPKAFSVLVYLVARAGEVVSREELLQAVWPATYVDEHVLSVHVREVRTLLGDQFAHPLYIETRHGRGYRFTAAVHRIRSGDPTTAHGASGVPHTNLVGRDHDLARLHSALRRAKSGTTEIVFVPGEPGIGKTALIENFISEVRCFDEARVALGQCLDLHGAGEPYLPVLEAMGRLSRSVDRDTMISTLERYAPTWLAQLPSLLNHEHRQSLRREILGTTRQRMIRELAEAVEVLTSERSLVIVLEDLHWSDPSTLDLISALARLRNARLLVIGTYRPTEVILRNHPLKQLKQELQIQHLCQEFPLELLTKQDVTAYLAGRFGPGVVPDHVAAAIHRRTEGNPLFIASLIDCFVAQGQITQ